MARESFRKYTRSAFGTGVIAVILLLAGAFMLLPMVYLVITSLKPIEELLLFPPRFFVMRPTITNYTSLPQLLSNLWMPFSRYLFNSIFVSVVSTLLSIVVASMAAFVMSKYNYRFVEILFLVVQFTLLYNGYTLGVPQYLIYSRLHLLNSYWVYILPQLSSTLGVFLIKQYMDTAIPGELMEAARIDGAGCLRIYWSIAMPAVKPALLTLLLFCFRDVWSMSAGNTIFDEQLRLLPDALSQIAAGGIVRTGPTMAASVLLMLPPIIVYLITQSRVIETMSSSGIKG